MSTQRTILLLTLICFFPLLTWTQNWAPLRNGLDYYFEFHPDSLHLLRIDSTALNGADSVYYINQVATRTGNNDFPYTFWDDNVLMRGWQDLPGSEFTIFSTNGDSLFFKPNTPLNALWVLHNGLNPLTASITSKTVDNVFGTMDSVITIAISNGTQVRLSKSFGFLEVPDLTEMIQGNFPVKQFSLVIEPAPKLQAADFYNYQPGDELVYLFSYSDWWDAANDFREWTYYTVLSRTDFPTPDSILYNFRREEAREEWPYTSFSQISIDTITALYKSHQNEFLEGATHTFTHTPLVFDPTHFVSRISKDPRDRVTKEMSSYWVNGIYLESIIDHFGDWKYKEGVGFLGSYGSGWGADGSNTLVCYTIGGNTSGNCLAFEDLVGIESTTRPKFKLAAWPNPAEEVLNLRLQGTKSEVLEFQLVDMLGRVRQKIKIRSGETIEIPIPHLETGIYLLQEMENGLKPMRINIH